MRVWISGVNVTVTNKSTMNKYFYRGTAKDIWDFQVANFGLIIRSRTDYQTQELVKSDPVSF